LYSPEEGPLLEERKQKQEFLCTPVYKVFKLSEESKKMKFVWICLLFCQHLHISCNTKIVNIILFHIFLSFLGPFHPPYLFFFSKAEVLNSDCP